MSSRSDFTDDGVVIRTGDEDEVLDDLFIVFAGEGETAGDILPSPWSFMKSVL